jgi:hypothetical protein
VKMATLSSLVSIVARVSGLPESTVFSYGRFAREAGLISQAGRGLGGAQMKATDAANLLLAVSGTRITKEAANAIKALKPLQGAVEYFRQSDGLAAWMEHYSSFAMSQTGKPNLELGTFVSFLITEACTGAFEKFLRSLLIYDAPLRTDAIFEKVRSQFEADRNSLRFKSADKIDIIEDIKVTFMFNTLYAADFRVEYNMWFTFDSMIIRFGEATDSKPFQDLVEYSSFSQRTILAIGDCLTNSKDRD